jgi:hypothetical protein
MVQCDGCEVWYHYDCLEEKGRIVAPADVARLQWFCPEEQCQRKDRDLRKEKRGENPDDNVEEGDDGEGPGVEDNDNEGTEVIQVTTQCTKKTCRKWRDVDRVFLVRKQREAVSAALPKYLFVCKDARRMCHAMCDYCSNKVCMCKCNECGCIGTLCECPAYI